MLKSHRVYSELISFRINLDNRKISNTEKSPSTGKQNKTHQNNLWVKKEVSREMKNYTKVKMQHIKIHGTQLKQKEALLLSSESLSTLRVPLAKPKTLA